MEKLKSVAIKNFTDKNVSLPQTRKQKHRIQGNAESRDPPKSREKTALGKPDEVQVRSWRWESNLCDRC